MQTYYTNVDTMVMELWSLSLVPRDDIITIYLKILEDVPQWDEDGHGIGAEEMLNGGMNYLAYFERTWVSFNNFV